MGLPLPHGWPRLLSQAGSILHHIKVLPGPLYGRGCWAPGAAADESKILSAWVEVPDSGEAAPAPPTQALAGPLGVDRSLHASRTPDKLVNLSAPHFPPV